MQTPRICLLNVLPGRGELGSSPPRPRAGTEAVEGLECRPQVPACQPPLSRTTEALAVTELGTRALEWARRRLVQEERLLKHIRETRLVGNQPPATASRGERPRPPRLLGPRAEFVDHDHRLAGAP